MIGGADLHRINNVAARVVHTEDGVELYHPDCLAEVATGGGKAGIDEEDVNIDHEYCGGGKVTRWDDTCSGCNEELGDSGGVQPDDDDEEEDATWRAENGSPAYALKSKCDRRHSVGEDCNHNG